MGRKKKQTEATVIKSSQTETLKYKGTVKVSLSNGKNILSTKTYHNNGHAYLFRFICNALAGNFVDTWRPTKIALFGDENFQDKLTPYILNDTTATVATNNSGEYTVTYHFRIPCIYIKQGETGTTVIKKTALFCNDISGTIVDSICADCAFSEPITIDNFDTYSLIIEWTMTIKNI